MTRESLGVIWSAVMGAAAGFTAALLLINDPSRFLPILRPFGAVGFVLGNVHQGSDAISIAALMGTFPIGGAVIGALCAFAAGRVQKWIR